MICTGGWYYSRLYKLIYRGGWCSQTAPINRFVGTATVPTAPTNHFSTKKIKFKIQIGPEHIFFLFDIIVLSIQLV